MNTRWPMLSGLMVLAATMTFGQALVIDSFRTNGDLTWTYPSNGVTECRVEVTTNLQAGPWTNDLTGIAPTGANMSATVPLAGASRFYRVAATVADYLIVDLSAGPSASSYAVSYLTNVPVGGWTDEYKTTKMVFRCIPAGTFTMGSPTNELGRDPDETEHQVTLTQPFYVGVFQVTQRQWERVVGTWPSYFNNTSYCDSRPVEQVSYNDIRGSSVGAGWPASSNVDAGSFMGLLRARTGLAFDLPTESQWEYAGRAGTTTALTSGYNLTNEDSDAHMDDVGRYWYNGGSNHWLSVDTSGGTATVGSYLPNAWGLYDIHGNVWEWCLDWYGAYPDTVFDPEGATTGADRMMRGGGCYYSAGDCRLANRFHLFQTWAFPFLGFRAVLPLGR